MKPSAANGQTITVDVRPGARGGGDPFSKIMSAVAGMGDARTLRLLAPFEPVPLFSVMASRGFTHQARQIESGDWEILFTLAAGSRPEPAPPAPCGCGCSAGPAAVIELDARGLEPPQPMIVILEKVAALSPGAGLRARTDRRPMHLYAQLEERGFTGQSEEQPDGSFITHIRRH